MKRYERPNSADSPPRAQGLTGPPVTHPDIARETKNPLGAYLRARRDQVAPQQAGLGDGGVRRVPGLRREEVAMLAGISADYYLRLERGRDRHPSAQVLDALGRVLQLDGDHFAHLHALAAEPPRDRAEQTGRGTLPDGVERLVGALARPAFVETRSFDVLASNASARALSPRLVPGRNQLRDLFLDPAEQALYHDWESATVCFTSSLRKAVGGDISDPDYLDLVGRLTRDSPRFRLLWPRHEVGAQRGAPIRFDHPLVGKLTLHRERLAVSGADDMMLVVYYADAGTRDAEKLALL